MYCRKLHHNSTICCQSPTFRHHSQAYANNYSSNHIYILGHPPGFHPCPLLFGTQTFYLVKCIQPDVTNYQHPIILLMTIKSLICHTDLFPDTKPIFLSTYHAQKCIKHFPRVNLDFSYLHKTVVFK